LFITSIDLYSFINESDFARLLLKMPGSIDIRKWLSSSAGEKVPIWPDLRDL
jgi:hypothetical protein